MRPSIVLGPGDRLQPLGALLGGMGWDVRRLHDWADLGRFSHEGEVVVVIDAESTPQEDLGFVRRSLEKNPAARAIAMGEDARARVARRLLAMPHVRWVGWPPDIDDILSIPAAAPAHSVRAREAMDREGIEREVVEHDAPRTSARASQPTAPARARDEARAREAERAREVEEADEIARVQSILEGDGGSDVETMSAVRTTTSTRQRASEAARSATSTARESATQVARETATLTSREAAPQASREAAPQAAREAASQASQVSLSPAVQERNALGNTGFEDETRVASLPASGTTAVVARAPETAPTWWRAQIADLADAAQRIELGVHAVQQEPRGSTAAAEQVDVLEAEVARLVQFARTLGYVAAPPGRGAQVFDLAEMVQVFVKELADRPDAPPRCLFRAPAYVWVRSDRALLGQVFDALFWLAGACARGGELVRAQVSREGDMAEARLEFPTGPLEGLEIDRILEPYGLRRVLPDLGPNALSAAQSILTGQGGHLDLERPSNGRLEWTIELPAVEAPANGSSTGSRARREPAAGTPRPEID